MVQSQTKITTRSSQVQLTLIASKHVSSTDQDSFTGGTKAGYLGEARLWRHSLGAHVGCASWAHVVLVQFGGTAAPSTESWETGALIHE